MSTGDLYVHADLHGASSIVVKNPSSKFSQLTTYLWLMWKLFHVHVQGGFIEKSDFVLRPIESAECSCRRTIHSSVIPLLDKPFMRTDFSKHAFRSSAPTVWNSLPQTVLISYSPTFLNPDLKLFCSIRLSLNTDPTCHQRL